jgi:hypothetical protein
MTCNVLPSIPVAPVRFTTVQCTAVESVDASLISSADPLRLAEQLVKLTECKITDLTTQP